MKKITLLLALAVIAAISPSVIAGPPVPLPDAGTSSSLLGIAVVGLVAARRFFKK